MPKQVIYAGGVFDAAPHVDASTARDLAQFKTVGAEFWPPGPRASVPPATLPRNVRFSKVGMGAVGFGQAPAPSAQVSQAISKPKLVDYFPSAARSLPVRPVDAPAAMLSRVSPFDMTGAVRSIPGFTPKGGILDGAAVGTGLPGGGAYFEARSPRVIGTGAKIRSIPDPMLQLKNIAQVAITPPLSQVKDARRPAPIAPSVDRLSAKLIPPSGAPRPDIAGRCPRGFKPFIDVIEGPKCIPATSFQGFGNVPRMYGRSVFEGPVVGDRLPKMSLQPPFRPVSGFGAGPDGLGSDCGCGGWRTT